MIGFTNGMKFNGMGFLFILPEISFETIPATPERQSLKVFTIAWLFFAIHWFYGQVDSGETKLDLTHKQAGPFFFSNSANLCCTTLPSLAFAWNTIIPGFENGKTLKEATMNPMLQKFAVHSQFLFWAVGVGTKKKQLVTQGMRDYFERMQNEDRTD